MVYIEVTIKLAPPVKYILLILNSAGTPALADYDDNNNKEERRVLTCSEPSAAVTESLYLHTGHCLRLLAFRAVQNTTEGLSHLIPRRQPLY